MTDYSNPAQVKAQPGITGTGSDTVIASLITAASRAIDNFCNRPEGFVADETASIRYYVGRGKPWLFVDDIATASSLAVAVKDAIGDEEDEYVAWIVGTVGTTTGADVFPATGDPSRPDFNHLPYTMLVIGQNGDYSIFPDGSGAGGIPMVKVTARWGYATTTPAPIEQACITQVCRWLARGQSKWADTLGSAEMGIMIYRKVLDPDIEFMLVEGRYVRPAIG